MGLGSREEDCLGGRVERLHYSNKSDYQENFEYE